MNFEHASAASADMPQSGKTSVPFQLKAVWQALAALGVGVRDHVLHNRPNDGPPDLDELWRDFNRKLSQLFAGKGGSTPPNEPNGLMRPSGNGAGIGAAVLGGLLVLVWAGSGIYTVQEGQQAVVMSFGSFSHTTGAGLQVHAPYPFQTHEIVNMTQLRSLDVGSPVVTAGTGLRDSSMLTQDENIIDIQFTVQYRLTDARLYLFENKDTDAAVQQASESAVREVVGSSTMDSVLYEQRDAIAAQMSKTIQMQLDRIKAGVSIVNVNIKGVQAPDQVQAAFDDAFKAGADRERFKNEGQAYANDIIPKAQGTASRLREEAAGYSARVVAQAEGDSERFKLILAQYQKAPSVTQDRLYLDTMQQVFSNVTKVMVDSRQGSNLLYLPLDKLVGATTADGAGSVSATQATVRASQAGQDSVSQPSQSQAAAVDTRVRDESRSRDRDVR